MSVALHGKQAQESTVLIDTTVQEKNITYPLMPNLPLKSSIALISWLLINLKQQILWQFALQFSDELVSNSPQAS
jgi:hypothetical protein